jgi:hypothetical protein
MSTYNNVLGNFISYSNDLSDLGDDDYEDSGSEPEPKMDRSHKNKTPAKIKTVDERTQYVETLLSKLNKYRCICI